jgi:ribosomal protection tetracycline resistance protein
VEKQLSKALEEEVYGRDVIDLKITLIEGVDHVMHSKPGDFLIATPMGIMDGPSKNY